MPALLVHFKIFMEHGLEKTIAGFILKRFSFYEICMNIWLLWFKIFYAFHLISHTFQIIDDLDFSGDLDVWPTMIKHVLGHPWWSEASILQIYIGVRVWKVLANTQNHIRSNT